MADDIAQNIFPLVEFPVPHKKKKEEEEVKDDFCTKL